jgi:gliding motility-associated-like protein
MSFNHYRNISFYVFLIGWVTSINFSGIVAQVISPFPNCIEVLPDGSVNLQWIPSDNSGGSFTHYTLYSNTGGDFSPISTFTTISTSSYTDFSANANTASIQYYLTASYTTGGNTLESPPIDTISTIFLNLNNPTNGTAILQWNDPFIPISESGPLGEYYYIWQEFPLSNWSIIDSVAINDVNYYRDTISICSAFLNYRISAGSINGCSFFSNVDGDQFNDMIAPYSPIISNVSVDSTTGNAVINWYPSESEDAVAYIVLTNISGGWVILDTVYGYQNTTYSYTNSNADLISEQFGISAFDSCWRGNPLAPNTSPMGTSHRSIFARNTYKVCDPSITINWNRYINWSAGVHHYEIFRKTGNSAYQLLSQLNDPDTVFIDNSLTYNTNYCYLIRAISGDTKDTAISNITCRYASRPSIPNYSYLSYVTVEDDKTIEVGLHNHLGGITREIILERSQNDEELFDVIATRSSLLENMIFTDTEVLTQENIYQYRVTLIDSCENISRVTNVGKNILLNVQTDNANLRTQLTWSAYEDWQQGIANFEIYRSVSGLTGYELIATLPPAQLYYEDDLTNFIGTSADGLFCYYVKAVETINTFGFSTTSASNQVCATMQPLVFVPNALIIGGINDTWLPVVNLLNFDSYVARIYTRFGEVIFETNDPYQAWDGRHKGEIVPLGVYIYQITFDAGNGKFEDVRGAVTVVR